MSARAKKNKLNYQLPFHSRLPLSQHLSQAAHPKWHNDTCTSSGEGNLTRPALHPVPFLGAAADPTEQTGIPSPATKGQGTRKKGRRGKEDGEEGNESGGEE